MTGISRLSEELDNLPMDESEREGGELAFSALIYQYGGQLDARVLVGMWVIGFSLPRILHAVKKKRKQQVMEPAITDNTKEVKGEVLTMKTVVPGV